MMFMFFSKALLICPFSGPIPASSTRFNEIQVSILGSMMFMFFSRALLISMCSGQVPASPASVV
jgi:hypothetical protein